MRSYAMYDFFQVKLVLMSKFFRKAFKALLFNSRTCWAFRHPHDFICLLRNIRSLFNPQKFSKVKKTNGNLKKVISKFIKLIMQNYGRALVRFASIRTIASCCYNNRVCLGRKLHSKLPQKQTESFVSFS